VDLLYEMFVALTYVWCVECGKNLSFGTCWFLSCL